MRTTFIAAAFAMLVLFGWSRPAAAFFYDSAGDFPATACQKVGTAGTFAITSDGAIFNNSAFGNADMTVDCPVGSTGQGFQIGGTGAPVFYLDNSTSSITCTLRAEDAGSTAVSMATASSTGDDNIYRSFTFPFISGFAGGQAHMRCTLPAKDSSGNASFLIGYGFNDDGGNDPEGHLGTHNFTGSFCRAISGGSAGITADGATFNDLGSGGTSLLLDCPLFTSRAKTGVTVGATKLWYLDHSPAAITCTLAAEDAATTATSTFTISSNFDDNNYHSMNFSGSSAISTFAGGFVHVRCSVPPRDSTGSASFVVGYGLEIQ